MKKIFLLILTAIFGSFSAVYAQCVPQNVQDYVKNSFKDAYFRYDGVIILPDNTVYLPVIPAKFDIDVETLEIKETIPANKDFAKLPDAVIFNNEFVLLKVIKDKNGNATLLNQTNYPTEIKSGILPQDILLPRRLEIPEGLNNIKGTLETYSPDVDDLRQNTNASTDYTKMYFNLPALKNSVFYITTPISKNIKVMSSNNKKGYYIYQQKSSPNKIALYDDRYLLVSSYSRKALNVISIYDDALIKEIPLKTTPDEILIYGDKAYVTSSEGHCIYVIDLVNMTPTQQILINGMCEKLIISEDGTKLFYYDKQTKTLWGVEIDNDYLLKDIGLFPNVSKIAYTNGKVYVTSRTKNRVAIIDYLELNLTGEYDIEEKPVDLYAYNDKLYILSAKTGKIQVMNTETDDFVSEIQLPATDGFPNKFYRLKDTQYLLISDSARCALYVLDMNTNTIVLNQEIDEPVTQIEIGKVIRKFNDK